MVKQGYGRIKSCLGQFTFTTHSPGNHKMCISSNDTSWTMPGGGHGPQKLRVDLSLSIGENKDYYKVEVIMNLIFL